MSVPVLGHHTLYSIIRLSAHRADLKMNCLTIFLRMLPAACYLLLIADNK